MRDYADRRYKGKNRPSASAKAGAINQGWLRLVPSWAWLVFGIFVGYGLAHIPFLSSLQSNKTISDEAPNFDEKLAREIQDLKATNEAANKALKEDLANIKKASLEAGNAAKKAAKQAQITAGQVEKTAKQTTEKVESVEQKIGDVEKLVTDNKVEKSSSSPKLSLSVTDNLEKEQKKSLSTTENLPKSSVGAPKDSQVEKSSQLSLEADKQISANKDKSLNFDFYELLSQSEVKVAIKNNRKNQGSVEEQIIVLQVGSFRNEADAKRHKGSLDKLNLGNSKIVHVEMQGAIWYRVYLGPYNSRRSAAQMQNRLAQSGFEALQIKLK